MPTKILIRIGDVSLEGELSDTPGATEIARRLPLEAAPREWGDEFYFEVPLDLPPDETATTRVEVGDIGYWPPGRALAIFFGPTPMSSGDRPVPASAVNLIGRVTGNAALLRQARGATRIRLERA